MSYVLHDRPRVYRNVRFSSLVSVTPAKDDASRVRLERTLTNRCVRSHREAVRGSKDIKSGVPCSQSQEDDVVLQLQPTSCIDDRCPLVS